MKLIIDANLVVSAYTSDGQVRKYWQATLRDHQLLISPEIFGEIEVALRKREFSLSEEEVSGCLRDVLTRCALVRVSMPFKDDFLDPGDRHIVALASQIKPDLILTGDKLLLSMGSIANIPVVSVRTFCDRQGG